MIPIFIDTSAWYALMDRSDQNAKKAAAFYREHARNHNLLTTDVVLSECWRLAHHRLGWKVARQFMEGIQQSHIQLHYIQPEDLHIAWRILNDYSDQELSLVDALSFSIMERNGISRVFTFDKDFLIYRYGPRKQHAFTCYP